MVEGYPDSGQPSDYSEEQLKALSEMDKAALSKNQKAAVARWKFQQSQAAKPAQAEAPAAPPAPAGGDLASLPPEIQELAKKDPNTLTKEERIALGKAKSQAAKAAMAAKAAGGEPATAAAPAGPSPEELAAQKGRERALDFAYVKELREALPDAVDDVAMQTNKPYVVVKPREVARVARYAKDVLGFDGILNLTAADYPPGRIEVVYNLYHYRKKLHLALKAKVPRDGDACSVPSITPLYAGADWLEREVWDLFGVRFPGHPNPKRLLLPEGWAGHPLRKDYDLGKEQYVSVDERGDDVVSFDEKEGW